MKITEEMLVAFADGELDAQTREEVAQAVAADPALKERVEAHQRLRETLAGHFAPIAAQPVPDHLKALLEPRADAGPDNVVSLAAVRAKRSQKEEPRRWLPAWGNAAAIAATLVLGLAIGQTMNGGGPVTVSGNNMLASGALEKALDTQLASVQPASGTTRIGLTFRNKDGEICRTFAGEAVSGLACQAKGAWQLEQLLPGASAQSDYRQASAADPRIAASVQDMIAGDPFDGDTERAARDAGWGE